MLKDGCLACRSQFCKGVRGQRDKLGVSAIMDLGMVRTPSDALSAEQIEQTGDHRVRGDSGTVEDSGAELGDQIFVLGQIGEDPLVSSDRNETAVVNGDLTIGHRRGEGGDRWQFISEAAQAGANPEVSATLHQLNSKVGVQPRIRDREKPQS